MERIVEHRRGKKIYYYYSNTYRVKLDKNQTGKTKGSGKSKLVNEQVYLGSAKDVLEMFKEQTEPKTVQTKSFGLPVALWYVAEEIGLVDIINRHIKKRKQGISIGDYIVIGAINNVGQSTSKNGLARWYESTVLPRIQGIRPKDLTSQSFWEAYDKVISEKELKEAKIKASKEPNEKLSIEDLEKLIDDSKIELIEEDIWKVLQDKYGLIMDMILYDTTNFFSYNDINTKNSLMQKGKNKHHRDDKRQVGLALGVLRDLQIPVIHKVYGGNIHDATLFPTAIRGLISRYLRITKEAKDLTLVFDKGNNSHNNFNEIETIDGISIKFVGSLVPSQHLDLLRIPLSRYKDKYKSFDVYRGEKKVFNEKRVVIITYNEKLAKRQKRSFDKQIEKVKLELKEVFRKHKHEEGIEEMIEEVLKQNKIGHSKALRFLKVEIKGDNKDRELSIRRNKKECKVKELSFGKNIIFSNMMDESTYEIIKLHKDKHQLEDVFKMFNDGEVISFSPMYHWTDSKIRVYAFVCVLSLLLVKLLEYKLKENNYFMSPKVLITELKDIQEVIMIYSRERVVRKIREMSTIQNALFNLYKLEKYTLPP